MRARMWGAAFAAVVLTACVGTSSSGDTNLPSSSGTPPSPSLSPPTVTMSIADHARLTHAVAWQVMVNTASDDAVQEVDFLVDGTQKWIENQPPYFFDDDDQVLTPWLLGEGKHVLTAHVVTLDGASADATANVTVRVDVSRNRIIAGTYRRRVTPADQRRVESYRVPSKGAFGNVSPTGTWTLHIGANGEIVGVDPSGDASNPFVEPFTLTASSMRLYGPAIWRQPNPDEPSLFCEPEQPSDYTWSVSGDSLTIRNVQKVCADRDIVFVGTWTKA
jgi:hypothetical protein